MGGGAQALDWGEGGRRRTRTQPPEEHSVQKFLTPSPLPPLQLSPLLPPGRPGIRAVFQDKKDPMTSHLLPLDRQTGRSGPALTACQERKGAGKGVGGGLGCPQPQDPEHDILGSLVLKIEP